MKNRGILLLMLAISAALLTVNHQISKVGKYAESVEEAVDIVGAQVNTLHKGVIIESEERTYQIGQLQQENKKFREEIKKAYRAYKDLSNDVAFLESRISKEQLRLNQLLGIDGQYGMNNILISGKDLDEFLNYKVYTEITVKIGPPDEFPDMETKDSIVNPPAIIIGNYVLMASHVSDAKVFGDLAKMTIQFTTPMGIVGKTFQLKVLGVEASLLLNGKEYPLEEKYRNSNKDFALFEIRGYDSDINFPFEIGNSNELRIGNFIYINGSPSIQFHEIARPGYVTSLSVGYSSDVNQKDPDEFDISQATSSGDSGSPIVAFRDGKPELVGIYLGWIGDDDDNGRNTRSRAVKINIVIDEIKNKLGIDLREIQHRIVNRK